jgi:signal transduction histidine kinase
MNERAHKLLAWPRTLFARLMVILLVGLVLAQSLSYSLVMMERRSVADRLMLGNLERDVASSVAMLDMLPPDQRAAWLERVRRENYSYRLDAGTPGEPPRSALARKAVDTIAEALQGRKPVTASARPDGNGFQVHLQLHDGSPLTIDVQPRRSLVSPWLLAMLAAQLVLLVACAWLAVRVVTRPLSQLASAAENLGPDLKAQRVPETGPAEVAHAAAAFNAMQARIAGYLDERVQILAAISHDLQTPITRMRLRVDLMEASATQQKFHHDLREMEHLVREGVAYARTLQGGTETPARIDPDALIESLAGDYLDAGHAIAIEGQAGAPLLTRPQALRRILTNLIDNALKFGADVTLAIARHDDGWLQIAVQDRGPGIPEAELERVMQPYYRLETSRNRGTGGTGLGLAIAQQLTQALGGTLQLANREGGGLQATLRLPW